MKDNYRTRLQFIYKYRTNYRTCLQFIYNNNLQDMFTVYIQLQFTGHVYSLCTITIYRTCLEFIYNYNLQDKFAQNKIM